MEYFEPREAKVEEVNSARELLLKDCSISSLTKRPALTAEEREQLRKEAKSVTSSGLPPLTLEERQAIREDVRDYRDCRRAR